MKIKGLTRSNNESLKLFIQAGMEVAADYEDTSITCWATKNKMAYHAILLILACFLSNQFSAAQYLDSIKTLNNSINVTSSEDSAHAVSMNCETTRIPIVSESLVGLASGSMSALALSAISLVILRPSGDMEGLVVLPLAYLGFIVGSSTGMYFVVRRDNPNTSWYLTNLSGLIGAVGGFGVSRILPGNTLVPMLILPFLFELIYVNMLVPNHDENVSFESNYSDHQIFNKDRTFDLYEQEKLLEVKVLAIRF